MLSGDTVNRRVNPADEAAIAEMRETRALALAGAVDAVSSRAIGLRVDLFNCMEENRRLRKVEFDQKEEIARLKAEIERLTEPPVDAT